MHELRVRTLLDWGVKDNDAKMSNSNTIKTRNKVQENVGLSKKSRIHLRQSGYVLFRSRLQLNHPPVSG